MSTSTPTKSHCSTRPARSSTMITEDLIWEVLVRLPTKSLMRFKCVSKLWYSIIRNPNLAIAHGGGGGGCFRGLLVLDIFYDTSFWAQRFFYVNPDDNNCPRLMQHHLTIREPEYTDVTPIVKGLIGLYNNDINNFTVCNIATQQFRDLPLSPSPGPASSQDGDVYYYFLGFDSVKEVFKVLNLCLCSDGDNISGQLTHVFTFGLNDSDMNWRTIAPAPLDLYFQSQECLCINGALYWLPSEGEYQQTLTAFHLNSESFETIAIPDCTKGGADLVEICGRPALVVIDITTDDVEMLDVWTMNNNCGGGELEAWTMKRVSLPTNLSIGSRLNYAGTLPTGEMMLAGSELNDIPLPVYIYDHLKHKLKSITLDGYGSREGGSNSPEAGMELEREEVKICYYEENVISLDFLMKY